MGAPSELVTVQHERAKAPKQVRISRNIKRAVDAMVHQGLSRADAAQLANIKDHALYVALTKPHVAAYRNAQLQVLRSSAASRTIAKAEQLMDSAKSESVQADMTKWLAGLEGISPIQRTENKHIHAHLVPGLTIVHQHREATPQFTELADGGEKLKNISGLPQPVPHPSMRNAAIDADFREIETPARPAPRGAK